MKLASLLTPQQVILDLQGETHLESITGIVDHLVEVELLDQN